MSEPTGTVRRWVPRVGDLVPTIQSHETGGYVLAKDYDALSAQAVALAQTVQMLCEKHGHTDYPSYQQAQALLDAQGRKG
jgi:hypothetical protein